jgi:hypothetical protein
MKQNEMLLGRYLAGPRTPVWAGRLLLAASFLALLASPRAAAAPMTMKLFGKTYNVECASRDQTFKTKDGKQVKIVMQPTQDTNYGRKAGLFFAEGADPSQDRLFVACQIGADDDTDGWHGFYLLTGADANGNFTPASATLTEFWGGVGDRSKNGRPLSVTLINSDDTGVKKDRNLVMLQWTGDNGYRLYDLDSLSTDYESDKLYYRITAAVNSDDADPGAPGGDYHNFVPLPTDDKHTLLDFGASSSGGVDVGIWDTKADNFFNALTNISEKTASASIPISTDDTPSGAIHYAENEYWFVGTNPAPGGNDVALDTNTLYRVKLTLPADLSKATPGSIGVEVLGKENLLGTPLQAGPGGVYGLAVGREVAPGLRRLYFSTYEGTLCVATPVP